jgi:hypothetical protein
MRHAAVAVALLFLALTVSAATFDLPTDAELLGRADLVVVATVLDSRRPAAWCSPIPACASSRS